jgi:hypothetical protein
MDGRYYIESAVCLVLGILCFIIPGVQVHNVRNNPVKRKKVYSLHLVVWTCIIAVGFLTLILTLDLRGAFGILPLNVRLAIYILDIGFVAIGCIEWAVGLVCVVAVSAGIFSLKGSQREIWMKVVPIVLYYAIGFSMEVISSQTNQMRYIGFIFLYLALFCAWSACLQIFSMIALYRHFMGGLEMKTSSKSVEMVEEDFKKNFKMPVCRLLMTFLMTILVFVAQLIGGISMAFTTTENVQTSDVLTADPNNYQISSLFAFVTCAMLLVLLAGLIVAWIPRECTDGPDVVTKATSLALELTWTMAGKWIFAGADPAVAKLNDNLNQSLLSNELESASSMNALTISK